MHYQFKLPIGDWSCDGHNECVRYTVRSNVPMKRIVQTYSEMDAKFNISSQMSSYEDEYFSEDFVALLASNGISIQPYVDDIDELSCSPLKLASLILDLMKHIDPYLDLEIMEDVIPELNSHTGSEYGYTVDLPGYGLFY